MPPNGLRSLCLAAAIVGAACSAAPAAPSGPATPATRAPSGASGTAPSSSTAPSGAPTGAPTRAASSPASSSTAHAAWSRLEPDGAAPAAREDHTWTAAPGDVAYLFGGRDGATVHGDLWKFDLRTDTWTRLMPEGDEPAGRFGHTATWVDGVGLVVWSGQAGPRFFDDLWAYSPDRDAWRRLPNGGERPAARYGSCASLGPDGRLWISHGFTAETGRFSDTRAYDFARGVWSDETPEGTTPVRRCLHDCLWTSAGDLVLFGGQTTGADAIGDAWSLSLAPGGESAWTEMAAASGPGPRQLYSLASIGPRLYVFGGSARGGDKLADLWVLDVSAEPVWSESGAISPPPARSGATLVADEARGRLLLFGGQTESGEVSDVWRLTVG